MTDFLTAMSSLFTFLFTQLGNLTNWFMTSLLGQVILGVTLFTFITYVIGYILANIRR